MCRQVAVALVPHDEARQWIQQESRTVGLPGAYSAAQGTCSSFFARKFRWLDL